MSAAPSDLKSAADSDLKSTTPLRVAGGSIAGRDLGLFARDAWGRPDAGRESVDATCMGDAAAEVRGGRDAGCFVPSKREPCLVFVTTKARMGCS